MFRFSTIIRELVLNLAKAIFYVKTFGKITLLFIKRLCGSMLPHNRIINNKVRGYFKKLPHFIF